MSFAILDAIATSNEPEFKLYETNDFFHAFCRHLVHEEGWSASELLYVIEKPYKYTGEFKEWLINYYEN